MIPEAKNCFAEHDGDTENSSGSQTHLGYSNIQSVDSAKENSPHIWHHRGRANCKVRGFKVSHEVGS